jgi:LysR family transcriptional regulator, low CO2-responsive transcriptional regulator
LAAVAASGTVTAAGQKLNLTQPAISLQIRSLQSWASLPLLQRSATGMTLSEAGDAVLLLNDRIEKAIADCVATLDMIKGLSGGRVSIGVVSTAKYFAPFAIAEFKRRFPGIDVRLTIGNRAEIIRALKEFALDIAITGRPPAELDLQQVLIGDHPHVMIAPPSHALAGVRKLKVRELGAETFIVRESQSGTRALMDRMFADAGVVPRTGMELTSNETIKQAVMAGLGIAFISAHTVANELKDRRLVALAVEGLPLVRHWYVVRRSEQTLLPPARALMEFLGTQAKQFLPFSAAR